MESDRPIDDAAKEIERAETQTKKAGIMIDAFDLEHPELGIEAVTENYVAAFDVPEIPSPNDPGRPISLCYDCWDEAGRPEAEQQTDDVIFQWAKEHDSALYKKLVHCERCGIKFGFVKD
jgi:hypothetical protein